MVDSVLWLVAFDRMWKDQYLYNLYNMSFLLHINNSGKILSLHILLIKVVLIVTRERRKTFLYGNLYPFCQHMHEWIRTVGEDTRKYNDDDNHRAHDVLYTLLMGMDFRRTRTVPSTPLYLPWGTTKPLKSQNILFIHL